MHILFSVICFLFIGTSSLVHSYEQADPVNITLVSENESIHQDQPFWVAVQFKIEPDWHAYWKNPGDGGMPPSITWNLPEGVILDSLLWPTPERFYSDSFVGFGFKDEFILLAKFVLPQNYQNQSALIEANVQWLVCSDSTCLPGRTSLSLNLLVNDSAPIISVAEASLFRQARSLIPQLYTSGTVLRDKKGVEIILDDSIKSRSDIINVDFFPEVKKTIDYKTPPVIEIDQENQHKIVLKEVKSLGSLKGVLVLTTNSGRESYAIDQPIDSFIDQFKVIGMNTDRVIKNNSIDIISTEANRSEVDHSFDFQGGLLLAILFAFLGGLLLNLMPCVFPVISFKIMGFIKLAGENRSLIFKHGLAFSFGVLLSFWVLAAILLTLQAYGQSAGWGFQLQEPIFVAILAAFLFLFALNLFGLFEMGVSVMSAAGQVQQTKQSNLYFGSFLSGVLATAVATPCTGPFLGSAVGYAVTLPPLQAMSIFTSLGLGMSSPYLMIAACPSLLRFLPKPGNWMVTFKELMGFLMLSATLWLVWVFSAQTDGMAVSLLLVGFFFFALAGWIYGRLANPGVKKGIRVSAKVVSLGFFSLGAYVLMMAATTSELVGHSSLSSSEDHHLLADNWENFSQARLNELNAKGTPVFIDFTAKWCLICQTNHLVLSKVDVVDAFKAKGIVRMKADWTKKDETISLYLRKFGRNSVPLYVLYKGNDQPPELLPQVLTPDTVLNALNVLN